MNAGGETADQAVRMTLQGIEIAANIALKAGGMASKSLAATLYAILTDKKKVKGKSRLTTLLKSGKELKVFAIRHEDLKLFMQEAKKYGVLYSVLKEKHNVDGVCDIMVRAEDASKISRIVDKFELATVDTQAIRESVMTQESNKNNPLKDVPILNDDEHDALVDSLMNSIKKEEQSFTENPSMARTKTRENQSEPTLLSQKNEHDTIEPKKSVRKELGEIKRERNQKVKKQTVKQRQSNQHKNVKKKNKVKSKKKER